jgi:NADH:ubiquinone oxidoreductase subunit K
MQRSLRLALVASHSVIQRKVTLKIHKLFEVQVNNCLNLYFLIFAYKHNNKPADLIIIFIIVISIIKKVHKCLRGSGIAQSK